MTSSIDFSPSRIQISGPTAVGLREFSSSSLPKLRLERMSRRHRASKADPETASGARDELLLRTMSPMTAPIKSPKVLKRSFPRREHPFPSSKSFHHEVFDCHSRHSFHDRQLWLRRCDRYSYSRTGAPRIGALQLDLCFATVLQREQPQDQRCDRTRRWLFPWWRPCLGPRPDEPGPSRHQRHLLRHGRTHYPVLWQCQWEPHCLRH
ncbi:hypothetical protein B0H10DRAFT_565149 [Mycena sp. CBHHK59/15]|nr:hypothetical protein B0H10DRAFT_565149 [Mycena sp. CBHHK59/15]